MWPISPPAWLLPWAISRFRGSPKPAGTPAVIPVWAWGFLKWAAWRRKGAVPPRPRSTAKATIPDRIPQWAWTILKQINIAVPVAPPPPPPLPAHPVPASSWKLRNPLVFTSWGWRTDGDFINVEVIGRRMQEAGIGTVALQIGLFDPDVPSRLRAFGFDIALWGEADSRDAEALAHAEADGYLPQVEGPSQYESSLNNLRTGVGAGLSRSVVITPWSFDTFIRRPDGTADGESTTVETEGLIEAGVTHAWVECYTGDMRNASVAREMWDTDNRGFHHANPVIGLARPGDVTVGSYQPELDRYGRQMGVYLAEPMVAADWQAIGGL